MWKYNLEQGRS